MQKKSRQAFALILIISALLMATAIWGVAIAQSTASITVLVAAGGTVDLNPPGGTYNDGTVVTLSATAGQGFVFAEFDVVSNAGSEVLASNPATLTVVGGDDYAVQAIFAPVQLPPGQYFNVSLPSNAIVVILAAVGGTTSPPPGTYAVANATSLDLTATPVSGFKFDHWVIGGAQAGAHGSYSFTATPTDNPYNVNHGYGNTYSYQPVFSPTTVPEFSPVSTAIMAILLVAVLAGAVVASTFKRNKPLGHLWGAR